MKRSVWVLSTAGLVRGSGRAATWIFLPLVLLTFYGLPYFQIGLLIAAIVPVSVVSNILSGWAGDRFGRRNIAVVPSFFSCAIMAAMYLFLRSGVLPVMALWAIGEFSRDMAQPAQGAMLGDVSAGGDGVRAYSIYRVFSNAGYAISPALGGFLSESYGLAIVFAVSSITNLGEGVVLLLFLRESFPGTRRKRSMARDIAFPFRDAAFLSLMIVIAGLTVLSDQFGSTLTLFMGGVRQLPYFQMGLVYSLNGVMVVTLQPLVTRLVDSRGSLRGWLALGSMVYGVGYLILLAGSLPYYFASMGAITMGENLVTPTQQTLVSESAPLDRRASYFGGYNATGNASKIAAMLLGTLVLGSGKSGPVLLWTSMFALSALVAVGFLRIRTRRYVPDREN